MSMFARELCQIAAVPSLSQPTRRNASRALGLLLTVSRRAPRRSSLTLGVIVISSSSSLDSRLYFSA